MRDKREPSRRWRLAATGAPVLVGVLIGAAIGYVAAADSTGASSDPLGDRSALPAEVHVFTSSPLLELQEARRAIRDGGGWVLRGRISPDPSGSALFAVETTLWASDDPLPAGQTLTLSVRSGPRDLERLNEGGEREAVAIVTADAQLLGLALVIDGDLGGSASDDLFFVAEAARLVQQDSAEGITAIEGLTAFFAVEVSPAERQQAYEETLRRAEEIALDAPALVDPVTEMPVHPSLNDIVWQLESGLTADSVSILPEVPFLVTVATPPTSMTDALVFLEAGTGRLLSWIDVIAPGWVEGESEGAAVETFKAYLEPPRDEQDLVVVVRDLSSPGWDSPLEVGEEPLVVIPFDAVAGASRARLIVDEGRYVPATPEHFEQVRVGSFSDDTPPVSEDP